MKYHRWSITTASLFLLFTVSCASDSRVDRIGFSALQHYNLGLDWLGANKLENAEVSFQKALQLDDKFGDAYIQLGLIYYVLYEREVSLNSDRDAISKYYNQSYNCLQKGLKYSPKNPSAYTGFARLQMIGRQIDGAVANLLKARELATPENISIDAIICYELGNCYLSQGKYQNAVKEYKNYLQLVPDGPERDNVSSLIKEIESQLEIAPEK
ncbi:MAG: tetratricopeptide repeat protein [Planctomycetes bacterium]|nr:tetratricopeptide repeat protein [Planctomycetota bacterium]